MRVHWLLRRFVCCCQVTADKIEVTNYIDTGSGVLDMKWSGNASASVLSCVSANGQLLQYVLRDGVLQLVHETESADCLYLSVVRSVPTSAITTAIQQRLD